MESKLNCVLMAHTPDPERVVAAAARLCYSADDAMTLMNNMIPEKVDAFITKLESLGHESPFEHVNWTFSVEGVSRVLTHQLVRHRLASYSQRSMRYVSEKHAEVVIPPSIANDPKALKAFQCMIEMIDNTYGELVELGVPKEDARYVLSNATETKIVLTMNTRTLYNFFHHRCCNRAQWEIRALANLMLNQVKEVAPNMFRHAGASCVKGYCPEATMCCGKAPTLQQLLEVYKDGHN